MSYPLVLEDGITCIPTLGSTTKLIMLSRVSSMVLTLRTFNVRTAFSLTFSERRLR